MPNKNTRESYKNNNIINILEYHIVWYIKYRHKVLTKDIKGNLLNKAAYDNNFKILEINGHLGYIHL
ncbi:MULTISPECIES: transposase [unclassified Clostridium]|uniref:transposase n=1 Tax=unclassified Clostridium TaxID=2614128 RepID=UPI000ECECC37|nr:MULTISPECIES: transposase [unclassified Clostridium]HCQ90955.1 hypothetical protein [Clostridium sp.]